MISVILQHLKYAGSLMIASPQHFSFAVALAIL